MAIESVTANAGTGGSDFAVDTITGSVQVPYAKLMSGADASEELIGGDAANGLDVDVTRVSGTVAVSNAGLTELAAAIDTEVQCDIVGALPAGDAAIGRVKITDGTDVADVLDLVNSNPIAVAIVDGDGTQLTSFGGGTQYTEDAAAAANPVGTALNLIRADTLGALTTTDGDNVAARGTDKGELYVKHVDAIPVTDNGGALTVDGTVAVTGVSTAANQTTIIGHLDGVEGLLTTIDGDTGTLAAAVSGTEMQVDVVAALPAGTNAIGKLAANSGVDIGDVDVTSISAGSNAIGNVGLIGRTSGGMIIFRSIDIDETEEEVKATAGQVFSISAFNTTAAPLYLKFYNATAANTTVGTTTPVLTFVVPGNADSDGAGFVWNNPIGLAFGTAITVACTTGVADNDTGAPGANACIVNIGYA